MFKIRFTKIMGVMIMLFLIGFLGAHLGDGHDHSSERPVPTDLSTGLGMHGVTQEESGAMHLKRSEEQSSKQMTFPKSQTSLARTIATYTKISRKALAKSDEKAALQDAWSSESILTTVRDALITGQLGEGWADLGDRETWVLRMAATPDHAPNATSYRRMHLVSFLVDAVQWEKNPARAAAIAAAAAVVTADSLGSNLPLHELRSIAGDKIELFSALARVDMRLAKEILDANIGTANEKVLKLAWRIAAQNPKVTPGESPTKYPSR